MNRVLVACTLTMVLLVLDSSIIGVMLPSIGQDLALSESGVAWVVSSYLLALAVLLPIGGRVTDSIGPVTAFVLGMAGFAGASAGIAFSGSDLALISWRAAAGAAAALLMPATLSILLGEFAGDGRARALAVYAGVGQAFATVGPAFGGLCAQFLGWQWGFLINIPVGVGGIALLLSARPANRRSPSRWDLSGAALLVVGATAIVTGLIQLPVWGVLSWATFGCLVVGTLALVAFVRRSGRVADPVLNLSLFASRPFTGGTLILACLGFGMTVATVYGAITLQQTLDLSPAAGGLALLPLVVPLLVATRWVATAYTRVGPRPIGVAGSTGLTLGLVVMAAGVGIDSVWVVGVGLVPTGIGIGLLLSPMTNASLSTAPESQRGQASGVVSTARQLGSVVGVGVMSACIAVIGVDTGAAIGFAITAAITLAGMVVAARTMPASVAPESG
jgi:DHA2 family methylenomycin A resistance protein-like MFS transporter